MARLLPTAERSALLRAMRRLPADDDRFAAVSISVVRSRTSSPPSVIAATKKALASRARALQDPLGADIADRSALTDGVRVAAAATEALDRVDLAVDVATVAAMEARASIVRAATACSDIERRTLSAVADAACLDLDRAAAVVEDTAVSAPEVTAAVRRAIAVAAAATRRLVDRARADDGQLVAGTTPDGGEARSMLTVAPDPYLVAAIERCEDLADEAAHDAIELTGQIAAADETLAGAHATLDARAEATLLRIEQHETSDDDLRRALAALADGVLDEAATRARTRVLAARAAAARSRAELAEETAREVEDLLVDGAPLVQHDAETPDDGAVEAFVVHHCGCRARAEVAVRRCAEHAASVVVLDLLTADLVDDVEVLAAVHDVATRRYLDEVARRLEGDDELTESSFLTAVEALRDVARTAADAAAATCALDELRMLLDRAETRLEVAEEQLERVEDRLDRATAALDRAVAAAAAGEPVPELDDHALDDADLFELTDEISGLLAELAGMASTDERPSSDDEAGIVDPPVLVLAGRAATPVPVPAASAQAPADLDAVRAGVAALVTTLGETIRADHAHDCGEDRDDRRRRIEERLARLQSEQQELLATIDEPTGPDETDPDEHPEPVEAEFSMSGGEVTEDDLATGVDPAEQVGGTTS